jgi:hypothetical protein
MGVQPTRSTQKGKGSPPLSRGTSVTLSVITIATLAGAFAADLLQMQQNEIF